MAVQLRDAATADDFKAFAALTLEYYEWLGEDLCFQNFEQELASLPGCYAPPGGAIILAAAQTAAAATPPPPGGGAASGDVSGDGSSGATAPPQLLGCVAVRPLPSGKDDAAGAAADADAAAAAAPPPSAVRVAEMKRLWVRPGKQGAGVGGALVAEAVATARRLGYSSVVLDTLERLEPANRLYARAGFRRRAPYYANPLPNVVYWQLDL